MGISNVHDSGKLTKKGTFFLPCLTKYVLLPCLVALAGALRDAMVRWYDIREIVNRDAWRGGSTGYRMEGMPSGVRLMVGVFGPRTKFLRSFREYATIFQAKVHMGFIQPGQGIPS